MIDQGGNRNEDWERKSTILCFEFRVSESAAERGRRYEGEGLRKKI